MARPTPAQVRRWSVLATVAGAATHHAFELGAGTGLMLQRELGLAGAAGVWTVALPALALAAHRDRARPVLAAAAGASLAACAVHFSLWPCSFRHGVPLLTCAEGLPDAALPSYNVILLSWGAASAATVAATVPAGGMIPAAAGFLLALPLRRHARRHFAWVGRQAQLHPAWWNRARIASRPSG